MFILIRAIKFLVPEKLVGVCKQEWMSEDLMSTGIAYTKINAS